MKYFLVILILMAMPVLSFWVPTVGIYTYYWLSFSVPFSLTYSIPSFSWAMLIALLTLLSWVIRYNVNRVYWNSITITLSVFFAFCTLTTLLALYPEIATEKWLAFLKIFIMTFVAAAVLTTKVRIHGMVWILVVSVGVHTVLAGITGAISVGSITVSGPPNSPYPTENLLARACIMIIPFMIYLGHYSSKKWVRYANWFGALASVSALIATGSRGGFIGFAAMLIYAWIVSANKGRNLAILGAATAVGLVVINANRIDTWTDRMSTITRAAEQATAQQRFDSWRYGYELAKESPITGGGFGAFQENYVDTGARLRKLEAHSNYFQVLGEHGFVGLTIYLALAVMGFRVSMRIERIASTKPDLSWASGLSKAIRFSLVGYFVGGLTVTMGYFELYYVLLGLLGGLLTYCIRQTSDEELGIRDLRSQIAGG